MGRFSIRAVLWFIACFGLAIWLLTLPPYRYWYKGGTGYTVYAPPLDYAERIGGATLLLFTPFLAKTVWRRIKRRRLADPSV